jgi:hypothetical protein
LIHKVASVAFWGCRLETKPTSVNTPGLIGNSFCLIAATLRSAQHCCNSSCDGLLYALAQDLNSFVSQPATLLNKHWKNHGKNSRTR